MNEPRIVIALLNAVWQTAVIAAFTMAILRLIGRSSASARCAVWMLAFAVSAVLPFADYAFAKSVTFPQAAATAKPSPARYQVTGVWSLATTTRSHALSAHARNAAISPKSSSARPNHFVIATLMNPTPETAPLGALASDVSPRPGHLGVSTLLAELVNRASGVLFWIWVCVAAICFTRLSAQLISLVRTKLAVTTQGLPEVFERQSGHRRGYTVGISDRISVPCLLGLVRPVIAIPASLAHELSPHDLKRIIMHESAHVRRYDDWFNLFEQLTLTLLFFNPALHYIARCANLEREIACDDQVIASEDRLYYAECLTTLARRTNLRQASVVPGFLAGRRQLLVRIEQLLDARRINSISLGRLPYVLMSLIGVLALVLCQVGIPVLAAAKDGGSQRAAQPRANVAIRVSTTANAPAATAATGQAKTMRVFVHAKRPVFTAIQYSRITSTVSARPHEGGKPYLFKNKYFYSKTYSYRGNVSTESYSLSGSSANAAALSDADSIAFADLGPKTDVASAVSVVPAVSPPAEAGITAPPATQSGSIAPTSVQPTIILPVSAQAASTPSAPSQPTTPSQAARNSQTFFILYSPGDLKKLRDHGVTESYIKALRAAGYTVLKVEDLTTLRDHGVSPSFAQAMRSAAGSLASVKALIEAQDHGVSAGYAARMQSLLGHQLELEQLTTLRDHGVSAQLAKAMASLSKAKLDMQGLTELSDHGVTPDYLRSMARLRVWPSFDGSLPQLPVKEITEMRDHGVTTGYIEELSRVGYSGLTARDLIRLRDHGVTPRFIERMRSAHNNARLSVDDLIRMCDHGN